MRSQAIVTETQFIDPLTFKKISTGDRVKVISPSGAIVELEVHNIGSEGTIVLGPFSKNETNKISASCTLVLGTKFSNKQAGFSVQLKDIVTVIDKSGHKLKMTVDTIIGNDFLLLDLPGNTKNVGLWNKLKFIWDIAKR